MKVFTSRGVQGSSPHTRGARPVDRHVAAADGIIPAYAGSTDRYGVVCPVALGSSPHTRGALRFGAALGVGDRIIPAYAGSTFPVELINGVLEDHPRIRGEHAKQALTTVYGKGSSPHTRGALSSGAGASSGSGIIPAYAGSTMVYAVL